MRFTGDTKEKTKMSIRILFALVTVVLLSLAGSNNASTISTAHSATAEAATRFSSTYTNLLTCPSGMTKKEEKEMEERGSDIPSRCKGPGGYILSVNYSACSSQFVAEKGDDGTAFPMQTVGSKQKTAEWRLANGKPFAIIMRIYEYAGDDLCATGGKITSEALMVKGLKGYEHIDATVPVKGTLNPNLKARQLADAGYAKKP
jgi:hypothetical protein